MAQPMHHRFGMLRYMVLGVALLSAALAPRSSEAGPPTEMLRDVFGEANKILADPTTQQPPQERLTAIRALFARTFDFRDAAERSLGRQWQARTAAEQTEFTRLFADFVQRAFVNWVASVADVGRRGARVTVTFLRESRNRDSATVEAAIIGRGGRAIPISHDLVYRNRRWLLRDVTIEGVSLVASYRAQFDRVIRASSYPELVHRLRARIADDAQRLQTPLAGGDAEADIRPTRHLGIESR
jgi:phospholipid transport system substrate-binding protein